MRAPIFFCLVTGPNWGDYYLLPLSYNSPSLLIRMPFLPGSGGRGGRQSCLLIFSEEKYFHISTGEDASNHSPRPLSFSLPCFSTWLVGHEHNYWPAVQEETKRERWNITILYWAVWLASGQTCIPKQKYLTVHLKQPLDLQSNLCAVQPYSSSRCYHWYWPSKTSQIFLPLFGR